MHWKLTNDVWWGDRHAVSELADKVGSVLCIAHNPELSPGSTHYNPIVLHGMVPYFRLGRHDDQECSGRYLMELTSLIEICLQHKPLLVHCYVGSHRSPAVALYAAFMDLKIDSIKELVELSARMYALKNNIRVGIYHKTLWNHMVDSCIPKGV